MKQPDVICLGEVMVEVSMPGQLPGPASVAFAGDTFNTAVYLKRSAPELRVAYATKLGRDRLSSALLAVMEEEGLQTHLVRRSDERMPGLYAISTDADGERSFTYWRDRSAAREMFASPGLELGELQATLLYFSAISLAILPVEHRTALVDWLPDLRRTGGQVAFDSNYRPALWPDPGTARDVMRRVWANTDIGLPSVDDEIALFGDADAAEVAGRLGRYGVRSGALKRGAEGPLALDGSAAGPFCTARSVVDSTAAGDSFNGAYLAARLQGLPEARALAAGHELACEVIGASGAILPRGPSRP